MDRNQGVHYDNYNLHWSLSARRAWIEIPPRKGSSCPPIVALRKESVDRNTNPGSTTLTFPGVALRKESVDRNDISLTLITGFLEVALRKESVDRNNTVQIVIVKMHAVALRKESVDRNLKITKKVLTSMCRSPQGERG